MSTRLGHANTGITASIYAHAVPGRDRAAAEVFRKFLEQPAAKARK